MTERDVKRTDLERGDVVKWSDNTMGVCRGTVIASDEKQTIIAMDVLAHSKPLYLVMVEDFVVEEEDKPAEVAPQAPPTAPVEAPPVAITQE